MTPRVEALIITTDNKAKLVHMKENRVQAILERKEKPEVFLMKDGRVLPIKDILVAISYE
jgi:rRNA pseudouridine-1189 N-methylase Emg1 (Nep1/Mra1 family)